MKFCPPARQANTAQSSLILLIKTFDNFKKLLIIFYLFDKKILISFNLLFTLLALFDCQVKISNELRISKH